MTGPLFLVSKSVPAGTFTQIDKGVPMPATGRTYTKIVKKGGKPMLAVFDQAGTLLGTMDPADLNKVQSATPDEQKQVDQQAAKVLAQHDPVAQQADAAESVTKACEAALYGLKPQAGRVAKSVGGMTVKDGFAALLKSLEPSRDRALRAAVSQESMKLMVGFGMPAQQSITVCKRAAVRVAQAQGLI